GGSAAAAIAQCPRRGPAGASALRLGLRRGHRARCGPVAVAHRFAPLVPDRLVSSRRRAAAVSAGPDPGPGGAGPSGAGTSGHRGGPFGRTRIETDTLACTGPSNQPGPVRIRALPTHVGGR